MSSLSVVVVGLRRTGVCGRRTPACAANTVAHRLHHAQLEEVPYRNDPVLSLRTKQHNRAAQAQGGNYAVHTDVPAGLVACYVKVLTSDYTGRYEQQYPREPIGQQHD